MSAASQRLQRAEGCVRLGFAASGGVTRLTDLYQRGCAKIRLPHTSPGAAPEAVLINTSGGLADGDVLEQSVALEDGARAVLTTQACERVYRAREATPARVTNTLLLKPGARLLSLPQETILFEGGRLHRTLDAEMAPDARLLVCEVALFGRRAMGEATASGLLREDWRVRMDGRLLHAEAARFGGDGPGAVARSIAGPATLAGAPAAATVLLAAPGDAADIEAWVERARAALAAVDAPGTAGVSGWEGRLVARLAAPDGRALRRALMPLLETLARAALDAPGFRLPKVWAL